MPPWLNILSSGAEDAGTQHMELINRRSGLNWLLPMMFLTVATKTPITLGMSAAYNADVAVYITTVRAFLV